jgi:5'-3' exonuclease
VWACLSEDMDMFVYGCPRVIRYFSLLNHTAVLYDMKEILEKLNLNQKELREICILSGTDYNINNENSCNIYTTFKYFRTYKNQHSSDDFYNWLIKTTDYIKDYELLKKINNMFDINDNCNIKSFENIKIINGPIIKNNLIDILKTDGFIFPL